MSKILEQDKKKLKIDEKPLYRHPIGSFIHEKETAQKVSEKDTKYLKHFEDLVSKRLIAFETTLNKWLEARKKELNEAKSTKDLARKGKILDWVEYQINSKMYRDLTKDAEEWEKYKETREKNEEKERKEKKKAKKEENKEVQNEEKEKSKEMLDKEKESKERQDRYYEINKDGWVWKKSSFLGHRQSKKYIWDKYVKKP